MVFQPGDPKPPGSGRQKGTRNKPRVNLSHHLVLAMTEELENIQSNLKRLRTYDPPAYFATLLKLLPYTLPRGGMDAVDQMAEEDEKAHRDAEALKRAHDRTREFFEKQAAKEENMRG